MLFPGPGAPALCPSLPSPQPAVGDDGSWGGQGCRVDGVRVDESTQEDAAHPLSSWERSLSSKNISILLEPLCVWCLPVPTAKPPLTSIGHASPQRPREEPETHKGKGLTQQGFLGFDPKNRWGQDKNRQRRPHQAKKLLQSEGHD